MLLAPARHSTAAELLRLGAAWLAVILALQCGHAAWAGTFGPLHRHLPPHAGHAHAGAQRHFHDTGSATQVPVAEADEAALALSAAMAMMAPGHAFAPWAARARPVWRAADGWVPLGISTDPPKRPPRRP